MRDDERVCVQTAGCAEVLLRDKVLTADIILRSSPFRAPKMVQSIILTKFPKFQNVKVRKIPAEVI
jgi:hypothetical protein